MTSDFYIEPVPVEAREQFRAMAEAYWRDLMPDAAVCPVAGIARFFFYGDVHMGGAAIDIPIGCLLRNSRLDSSLLRLKMRPLMFTIFISLKSTDAKGMDQKWQGGCLNTLMRRAFDNWISMCAETIRWPCLFGMLKDSVSRGIACECTAIQKRARLIKVFYLLIL